MAHEAPPAAGPALAPPGPAQAQTRSYHLKSSTLPIPCWASSRVECERPVTERQCVHG